MNATDPSTADMLRRAKQLIETHGWTRGQYRDEYGCICAKAAVDLAWHQLNGKGIDGYFACFDLLRAANGQFDVPLFQFNDRQKSVEPVLAAFDAAIALAESEAS